MQFKCTCLLHLRDCFTLSYFTVVKLVWQQISYFSYIESFNVFKNAIKGRTLDEFLSHWHSVGVIMHILYFFKEYGNVLSPSNIYFTFLLFILDFIVIGMWKPILIGCTNKIDWLLFLLHAHITQKHHFLTPWDQSQILCCWCSSTFYSNDTKFSKSNKQKAHCFISFFSVLRSKMSMITADRVACHDIGIVTFVKDYAFV